MNAFSQRTRSQNALREKTKPYKDNLNETQKRMRASSSASNLAGRLYSEKNNSFFIPRENRIQSAQSSPSPKLQADSYIMNPEMLMPATVSTVIGGLSLRASQIPSFSQMNTALLKEKKTLENKIAGLREGIIHQKNKLSRINANCKRNQNEIENTQNLFEQAKRKSKRLNELISETQADCNGFQRDLRALNHSLTQKQGQIEEEKKRTLEWQAKCRNLKVSHLQEDKHRAEVRCELHKSQRTMNSACICCKQLENERAVLLLEINKSVDTYKL